MEQYIEQLSTTYEKAKSVPKWASRGIEGRKFHIWLTCTIFLTMVLLNVPSYAQSDEIPKLDGTASHEIIPDIKRLQGYPENVSVEFDNTTSSLNTLTGMGMSIACQMNPQSCTGYEAIAQDPNVSPIVKRGLVGLAEDNLNTVLANPPSVDLVAHLSEEWVPGSEYGNNSVYAQSGYEYLSRLQISDLWGTTRMIAYALFVIALIVAGFMIMFRQKIGGQMAVTVFNTIPKVIVGLLLVTFSFAIVGLIIDFGLLFITIISSILLDNPSDAIAVVNPFSLADVLIRGEMGGEIRTTALTGMGLILGGTFLAVLPIPGVNVVGAAGVISGLVAMAIVIIVSLIVIYASVKVFITLLKAWVGIIADTIMGPLFLAIAVIPGRSRVGWNWFYRVVKNVLVFVVVFAIVNLAGYFYSSNIDFFFPAGLAGGSGGALSATFTHSIFTALMNAIVPLFLFFMAAEAPNLLSDLLPTDGGKGAATAMAGVQKNISKIPLVGSVFG